MGPAELDLLRQRAAGRVPAPPPFAAALKSLQDATPRQYTPHAIKDIMCEWYDGPKIGKQWLGVGATEKRGPQQRHQQWITEHCTCVSLCMLTAAVPRLYLGFIHVWLPRHD